MNLLARKSTQLTLNYEAGLCDAYASCREYVSARVHQLGKPQKTIAMDMDYSPSDLSRKLAQNPDDSRRFTLDDLETYVEVTSDIQPVIYLVEKYLASENKDELLKQIAALQKRVDS